MGIEIKIMVAWDGRRLTEKGHRGSFQGGEVILYLDESVSFVGGHIYHHLPNHTLKMHSMQITPQLLN